MGVELRPYQRRAVDAIPNYFYAGHKGNPLIVAPTGSGKSIMIAKFMEETLKKWSNQRMLMLAHRKELLEQNYSKLIKLWSAAPCGVYSAGLNSRQLGRKITIAGVQSVFRKGHDLGWQDLMIIDEAHLVPSDGEGMYRELIQTLLSINPKMKIIGFTATPFRLKTGMLIEPGGIFTDIAYEIEVSELIREGYLAPLVSKSSEKQADLNSVHVRGGEFVGAEAEAVMDDEALTQAAIDEMERFCSDRKSWIIFCSGVDHANHVASALNARGHPAAVVVGDTDDMFRAATLNRFKRGELKCLVNCDVLTTGFDAPGVDALILLRPTKSVGLYIQMCGRGMRLSPETGKRDCIVLDFAGNIERHGPIDSIRIQRKSGTKDGREVSTAPVKTCPNCRTSCPISFGACPTCGFVYVIEKPQHAPTATDRAIMVATKPPVKMMVDHVMYARHEKSGKTPSLKVTYQVAPEGATGNMELVQISEWVCVEHKSYAFQKAVAWWLENHRDHEKRETIVVPITVDEALSQTKSLRRPKSIYVQQDGQFERIISREFFSAEEDPAIDEEPERSDKELFDGFGPDITSIGGRDADEEIPF